MRRCTWLIVLTLAACAQVEPQPGGPGASIDATRPATIAVPEGLIADEVRLFTVSYPLLRAATDLCKDSNVYGMGLYALNRFTMGTFSNVAWRYGIGDSMRVLAAIPNGPAYRAGLTAGDIIVSVNGEPAPTTAAATRAFGLKMGHIAQTGGPVAMIVERGDRRITARVQPEHLCAYQVQVSNARLVNARADGRRGINITRGMMDFASSDLELALVVAHEIAHNALGHLDARSQLMRSLAANGRVPKGAGANGMTAAFSQALEMEADRAGLYIVARTGMDIDHAPDFIARLASHGTDSHIQTHPTSAARIAAMKKAVAEIERKQARGEPLVP